MLARPLAFSLPILFFSLLLLVAAPSEVQAQSDIAEFEQVYGNIEFDFPLGIRFPDDGTNRVYIVEWTGVVKVLENRPDVEDAGIFLDISERFGTPPSGELLAIEFHPDYAENGYFFVKYMLQDPAREVLARFSRSVDDPFVADLDSEVILLELETPGNTQNHYAGDLAFGLDGYLYMPTGDGGTYLDADGNAQDLTVLLGKVLRLDVDNPSGGLNYGIPPDNPYVGNEQGWREEIFAHGMRNPWRLTIDRATGDVWVGNVGEVTWEEVEHVTAGGNYGWPIMEGPECAPFGPPDCDQTGLTPPVWAYTHEVGNSITGGYVYRGAEIPVLQGKYVFADFAAYQVWYIDPENPSSVKLLLPEQYNVTTFGEDLEGELYFNRFLGGKIYKITPGPGATSSDGGPLDPAMPRVEVYPNPARTEATVVFSGEAAQVRLTLFDMLGRELRQVYEGPGYAGRLALDVRGLASGLYFLRMEAGEVVQTKKMIVLD